MKIPDLRWPADEGAYDDKLLLDIQTCVVAYLVRGRNAWQSTWVRHWFRDANLFTDVTSAKAGAESLRGRGNVFYIREVPALLLSGPHERIVLCNMGVDDPFSAFTGFDTTPVDTVAGRWIDGVYPGVSLRDAVAALDSASRHWPENLRSEHGVRAGTVPMDLTFPDRDGPLVSLKSFAQGSGYLLGWMSDRGPRPFKTDGAASANRRWHEFVSLANDTSGSDSNLAERLVTYRDQVLKAMPGSVWMTLAEAVRATEEAAFDEAYAQWREAKVRRVAASSVLRDAEEELDSAKRDRLLPADTSAGIRAQRERLERAEKALIGAQSDLAISRAAEKIRYDAYQDVLDS